MGSSTRLGAVRLRYAEAGVEARSTAVDGTRATAERVVLPDAGPYEYSVSGGQAYLALHDIVLRQGEIRVAGGTAISATDLRNTLTFLPAGLFTKGWADPIARRQCFTALHFDDDAIPHEVRGHEGLAEPRVYFRSKNLEHVLARAGRIATRPEPFAQLLTDTLCDLAIVELANGAASAKPRKEATGLSDQQVAMVREYVQDRLGNAVSLGELASVVGLSKFHFARAYRAATGRTPYRDVLEHRLATARSLLDAGEGLDAVAQRCGFTDRRRLLDAAKRITGSGLTGGSKAAATLLHQEADPPKAR